MRKLLLILMGLAVWPAWSAGVGVGPETTYTQSLKRSTNAAEFRGLLGVSESVDVKAYGAVGNGTNDDYTAIQNAVDTAGKGRTIYFPKGTYRLTNTIVLKDDNITLSGETPIQAISDTSQGSILQFVGSLDYGVEAVTNAVKGCSLRNMVVDGSGTVACGVTGTWDLSLYQCMIRRCGTGLYFPDLANQNRIVDVMVRECSVVGVHLAGLNATLSFIQRLHVTDCLHGVWISGAQRLSMRDSVIEGNTGYGLVLWPTNNWYVQDCRFDNIWFEVNGSGGTYTNQIYANAEYLVRSPLNNTFEGCTFSISTNGAAVNLEAARNWTFLNCMIRGEQTNNIVASTNAVSIAWQNRMGNNQPVGLPASLDGVGTGTVETGVDTDSDATSGRLWVDSTVYARKKLIAGSELQVGSPSVLATTIPFLLTKTMETNVSMQLENLSETSAAMIGLRLVTAANAWEFLTKYADNSLFLTEGGVNRLQVATGGSLFTYGGIQNLNGTNTTPAYTFYNMPNTGMWSPASYGLAFSVGGAEAARIISSTYVGLGTTTTNPVTRLALAGSGADNGLTFNNGASGQVKVYSPADLMLTIVATIVSSYGFQNADGTAGSPSYTFWDDPNTGLWRPGADVLAASAGASEAFRINASKQLAIGYTSQTNALDVNGTIVAGSNIQAGGTFVSSGGIQGIDTIWTNLISGVQTNRITVRSGLVVSNEVIW